MFKFFSNKIINKLVLLIVFVVAVISFILALYFNKYFIDSLNKTLQDDLIAIKIFAEEAYIKPLWNVDLDAVQGLNKAILRNKIAVAINIYMLDKIIVSDSKNHRSNSNLNLNSITPYAIPDKSDYISSLKVPILNFEKKIGELEIFYTTENIVKQTNEVISRMIISFFLIGVVTSLFLFFGVNKIAIKPIHTLIKTTQLIAMRNDLSIRAKKISEDEFGLLYEEFNEMISKAETREQEKYVSEKELKKVRNLLSSVLNSLNSILISITLDGKIALWNEQAVVFFNITEKDAIGKSLWEITNLLDKFKTTVSKIFVNNEVSSFYRENIGLLNDKFYDIFIFPVRSETDYRVVIRIDDVTELEKKEMQLRQAQKMETLGNLAGGLAHDFNNVLGGILGTVSLLKFKISKNKDLNFQNILDYIDTIQDSGDRAVDMVQNILALSRKNPVNINSIDLNISIKNVISICRSTFDKSVEIQSSGYKDPAIIEGDITQIEQVLLNLCVNASHSMTIMRKKDEHIGGVLEVSLKKIIADKNFKLAFPSVIEPEYWCISVKDDGVGIDKEIKEKIFEPFFTTKDKNRGTGLGLSMVFNIINRHSGFIDIFSRVGIGTTFSVYLPISKKEYKLMSKYNHNEDVVKGQGLILVVDDEEIMRNMAKEILNESGYDTILAKDGTEAVEIFKEKKEEIDLVLLDMVMPNLNGKETYLKIKELDNNVKVLLSSGFRRDERVNDILGLGVNAFLQKPYSLSKLSKIIYELVNG